MSAVTLTLYGAPRTKKNNQRRVMMGTKIRMIPTEAYLFWRDAALMQVKGRVALPDAPYNCAALFYRDALRGDAVGYYQGLADMLQEAGVVSDDKWIVSWDGSRLLKDARNPRVEVTLTPATEVSGTGSG